MIGTMYPQYKFNFDFNDVFFRDIPFDFVKAAIAFDMQFSVFTDHERLSHIKIPKFFLGLCGINICIK